MIHRAKEILNKVEIVPANENVFYLNEELFNPLLWSFEQPNLYRAEIKSGESIITEIFGFRSIEAKNNNLYLNGRPFYLIAALDQDFYPETIYTTPSEEYLRDEMLKAKQLGLNMLRCHIKVPDPLYLKVAHEIGLLVWYEVPNWDAVRGYNGCAGVRPRFLRSPTPARRRSMRSSPVFVFAALFALGVLSASAEDAKVKTVAALHQEKAALSGQTVKVQGKVVKVNNGIMGRNFLHVQDGTGDQNSNDLTVTSKQTAVVGDQVTVTGRRVLNRDFGAGYTYPLLVEDASITPMK